MYCVTQCFAEKSLSQILRKPLYFVPCSLFIIKSGIVCACLFISARNTVRIHGRSNETKILLKRCQTQRKHIIMLSLKAGKSAIFPLFETHLIIIIKDKYLPMATYYAFLLGREGSNILCF